MVFVKSETTFGFVALAVVTFYTTSYTRRFSETKTKVDPAMFDRTEAFWEGQFPASGALCRQKTNVAFLGEDFIVNSS